MDPLARAYAVLEIQRGCTPAELKKRYRDLVRRWHPDRHAGDAAGQAEATARLREINGAFRTIARGMSGADVAHAPAPSGPAPSAPAPGAQRSEPGRPLTRGEIDALIGALGGSQGPVDWLLDRAQALWPFGAAVFVLLYPGPPPPNVPQVVMAVGLAVYGAVFLVRKKMPPRE